MSASIINNECLIIKKKLVLNHYSYGVKLLQIQISNIYMQIVAKDIFLCLRGPKFDSSSLNITFVQKNKSNIYN